MSTFLSYGAGVIKYLKFALSFSFLIFLASLIFSCAGSYQAVIPPSEQYNQGLSEDDQIEFYYRYNVLQENGNKKYAKKEDKKGIDVVAIKIVNKGNESISFGEDLLMYAGNSVIYPIEPEIVKNELRQNVPIYLLYSLLFLNIYECDYDDCNTTTIPIGVGIAGFNMIRAGVANQQFLEELKKYDIVEKQIAPGETLFGLIGLAERGYPPLSLKRINKQKEN